MFVPHGDNVRDRNPMQPSNLDPAIKPLSLSDREIGELVDFLNSLTGSNVKDLSADATRDGARP